MTDTATLEPREAEARMTYAELAALTIPITKFYFYHDKERKAAGRAALRNYLFSETARDEDGMADVALEKIWNALVDNQ